MVLKMEKKFDKKLLTLYAEKSNVSSYKHTPGVPSVSSSVKGRGGATSMMNKYNKKVTVINSRDNISRQSSL